MNKHSLLDHRLIVSIDIGTNSMLMLGTEYKAHTLNFVFDHYFMPRLGEGFAQSNKISAHAVERAYNNLLACKEILDKYHLPYHVFITASSAIREAKNQKQVIETLEKVFPFSPIEIISGQEEARLSYLSLNDCYPDESKNVLFDIGGGSTEIAFGHNNTLIESQSIKFGTVKLLDMFFKPKQPAHKLEQARDHILKQLMACNIKPPTDTLYYGTAGSFTQCASMLLKLTTYSTSQINGFKLYKTHVHENIKKLSGLSIDQIKKLPGIDPKRADVILPGLIIIECLMQFFKTDCIKIYDRGIRYGKLFDVIDRYSG